MNYTLVESRFTSSAKGAGSLIFEADNIDAAAAYILREVTGKLILPGFESSVRAGLPGILEKGGSRLITGDFRRLGPEAEGGITGANFAIAETGTVVIESTPEPVRLASTLPEKHFVLLDRRKIIDTSRKAVDILREINRKMPRNFLAYITGPSRTADIERVLTIGVHGPKELHIILVPDFSKDIMES